MDRQRRILLKLGAFGTLLTPVLSSKAAVSDSLCFLEITDDSQAPFCLAGDWLLADSSVRHFSGEGIYLYPAWGEPRAYQVSRNNRQMLEFRNVHNGSLLWTQKLQGEDLFAARVESVAQGGRSGLATDLQALQVPFRP